MKEPLVSVVVTTYNRKDKLIRALESIENQTFKDWEIILVDDGSDDGTEEAVKPFITKLGEKLTYIKQANFGQHTRPKNVGTQAASAPWIAYLDDDNTYRRDHLQVLWKAHEKNPEIDCVYGMRMLVSEEKEYPDHIGISGEFNLRRLQFENYIDTSDVLCRKEAIARVGGWNETLPKYADWNLWLRLAKAGYRFKLTPIIITDYYVHKGMNQLRTKYEVDPMTGREKPGFDPTNCTIWPDATSFGSEPSLKVAIFTLTYDRLDYTKETFATMGELAGYSFDHFVVDNGSTDGSVEWLKNNKKKFKKVIFNEKNVGISKASNQALDAIGQDYDVILKVDNDCQFLSEDWLKRIVEVFRRSRKCVMSPYVEGLMDNPGGVPRQRVDNPKITPYGYIGEELIGFAPHLGGICIAAPTEAYEGFRWEDKSFLHGIQDFEFSQHCLRLGLPLFYLENVKIEHMDGTLGQAERFPDYFERRKKEKITRYDGK